MNSPMSKTYTPSTINSNFGSNFNTSFVHPSTSIYGNNHKNWSNYQQGR